MPRLETRGRRELSVLREFGDRLDAALKPTRKRPPASILSAPTSSPQAALVRSLAAIVQEKCGEGRGGAWR